MKIDSVQINNVGINNVTPKSKPEVQNEDFKTQLTQKSQEGLLKKAEKQKDILQLSKQSERILSEGEKSYIKTLFPTKPNVHVYNPEGKQVKIEVKIGTRIDVKG